MRIELSSRRERLVALIEVIEAVKVVRHAPDGASVIDGLDGVVSVS